MRVIIAGGREIKNYEYVKEAITASGLELQITQIISGREPNGVDALGERWAKEHGVPIEVYPADWHTYGNAAGPIRNKKMAGIADALIAIPGKGPGTQNMIREAVTKGIKVFVQPAPDIFLPIMHPSDAILEFRGPYEFLSMHSNYSVQINGLNFPTREHALHYFKTNDPEMREKIRQAPTPNAAKAIGRSVNLRLDWDQISEDVIYLVNKLGYKNPILRKKILETEGRILVEGNDRRSASGDRTDRIWGADLVTGEGLNKLGKVHMRCREEIQLSLSIAPRPLGSNTSLSR